MGRWRKSGEVGPRGLCTQRVELRGSVILVRQHDSRRVSISVPVGLFRDTTRTLHDPCTVVSDTVVSCRIPSAYR